MSSNTLTISVRNLQKAYKIRHEQVEHTTLADMLIGRLKSPFRRSAIETFLALRDISFDVHQGEIVGLIGRNGAGKSTLLKVLSRITRPTSGEVHIYGRVGSLLEVGTGFHQELTGRENIYLSGTILGMTRAEIKRQFDAIVEFSGVTKFLDTPVKRYSSGMYVRLGFSVAAHLNPEILLIDEVLAVGDAEFQSKCLSKMEDVASNQGRTVLFVSHNLATVAKLCQRAYVLGSGQIEFQGSAVEAVAHYHNPNSHADDASEQRNSHEIYRRSSRDQIGSIAITRIEVLDVYGQPKPVISTWDELTLRFTYVCDRAVSKGSVVLEIRTMEGTQLLLLSTQPDGTLPLPFTVGQAQVECRINKLPLSAGNYIVAVGFAIPNTEWLRRTEELATLVVCENDVYASGLPPRSSRSILALEHSWHII